LLIWLLPLLLFLIGYLIYGERKERRRLRQGAAQPLSKAQLRANKENAPYDLQREQVDSHADGRYVLDGTKESATQRYALTAEELTAEERNVLVTSAGRHEEALPQGNSFGAYRDRGDLGAGNGDGSEGENKGEDEDEDEVTIIPPQPEDEDATYSPHEVARFVVGYLVRTTGEPNLPKELPIYGFDPKTTGGGPQQTYIGRHSQHNTIVINDKRVSREHAVIIQRDGRLYLRDNASTAGTFLNWKQLTPGDELLLRHNDLIGFGQIAYEFRLHSEDEATMIDSE